MADLRDRYAAGELVCPLWPDAGRALGLGRGLTYAGARNGQIPGLISVGSKYIVAIPVLLRALGAIEEGVMVPPRDSPTSHPETKQPPPTEIGSGLDAGETT
jgi:hypothetical protein